VSAIVVTERELFTDQDGSLQCLVPLFQRRPPDLQRSHLDVLDPGEITPKRAIDGVLNGDKLVADIGGLGEIVDIP